VLPLIVFIRTTVTGRSDNPQNIGNFVSVMHVNNFVPRVELASSSSVIVGVSKASIPTSELFTYMIIYNVIN